MVTLPGADVALGRFEVTVEEFRAFAEVVPDAAEARCNSRVLTGGLPLAVTGGLQGTCRPGGIRWRAVSWNEAQAYVGWLSLETGQQYRLPTEAEWDRGAAGSHKGCYADFRNDVGTCVVGSYEPSDAGLFDMVGNLSEWTDSCWDGDCSRKVIRSSSWRTQDWRQRRDTRRWAGPARSDNRTGFRVASTLP